MRTERGGQERGLWGQAAWLESQLRTFPAV